MSEPRIFRSKDKNGQYTILMAENGAPPEKLAKFRSEDVAENYSRLFEWLYSTGEELTQNPDNDIAMIGETMFAWCDMMAGTIEG